ncbi:proteasome complex subunit Rpn13 ubiquitin receptor-domain-containing protein [Polychytrium aggregatum]|uniref:proteasome complex subunit Rpn13 ubiquitin receptor-domain-containing protein n=1 Tax=Polychytrium aggregatum TaxID=110093 RepID=UPI0022FE8D22|nr:proteasome complex subunit Rpn13 ubiquitin receptor-domain-containing protein [Polychytrium aggregatum]KAI9205934.1 proteasome complex subunit Rpn13 ubiquitin receptor-domain-containing protein [Polychytrium aggregatum]
MSQPQPIGLVEILAGKCERVASSNLIKPDNRKGVLILSVSDEDGLTHLYWKDRTLNAVQDDWIVFPNDASLQKIGMARTYVLKFVSSSERHFFWIQDPDEAKDAETIEQFNTLINNPPALDDEDGDDVGDEHDDSMQDIEQEAGPQQSSSHPVPLQPHGMSQPLGSLTLEQLRSILAGIPSGPGQAEIKDINLAAVLTADNVSPLLNDAAVCERLSKNLPASDASATGIRETLQSPQFRHSLRSLTKAIQSGQLGPMLREFGIDDSKPIFTVEALLKAFQEKAARDRASQ